MHADWDFDRDLERLIHTALDAETGPHAIWAGSPAAVRVAAGGRRRLGRWPVRILAVAAVLALGGAAVGGLIAGGGVVVDRPETGWVAFSKPDETGIYLVREGSAPRRITGQADGIVQACPTFSADGRRIAYAQATGNAAHGYRDVSMVIADLTPDGVVTGSTTWALNGLTEIPCGAWSSDGRWIAIAVYDGTQGPTDAETTTLRGLGAGERFAEGIWIVDTARQAVKRIDFAFQATDLEWSPDGTRLAIANDWITMYDVAQDSFEPVRTAGVQHLSWSPDGQRLAYDRTVETTATDVRTCSTRGMCRTIGQELWTIGADGSDATLIADDYLVNHGVGPVWSPDGTTIAYQRICSTYPTSSGPEGPCREQHEVVLQPVGADGHPVAGSTPVVIQAPRTETADGPRWWFPWFVTWSPDSSRLLYSAWASGATEEVAGLVSVPVANGAPAVTLFEGSVDLNASPSWGRLRSQ